MISESILALFKEHLSDHQKKDWAYPWNGLEDSLCSQNLEHLSLVGYGSLLEPESARRTIPDTPAEGHPPVLAVGGKRLFEYIIPEPILQRYGHTGGQLGRCRAALNLRFTSSLEDLFNGRLIQVPIQDLDSLREREYGYHLKPTPFVYWDELMNRGGMAYSLCADNRSFGGRDVLDENILPFPPYLNTCEQGAKLVSEEFLNFFRETTYLASGKTNLLDWK